MAKVTMYRSNDAECYENKQLDEAVIATVDSIEYFQATVLAGEDTREAAYENMWKAVNKLTKEIALAAQSLVTWELDDEPATSHK